MRWHRIEAIVLRHVYETRRNFDRITDTIYWPAMDVTMWGLFTIYLVRAKSLNPEATSFLLGAIILWNVFRSFERDMAVGFLAELWSRNLINLCCTPLSVVEYLTGLVLVNLVKSTVGMTAASLIAWSFYRYDILPMLLPFLPFIINLIVFALVVGLLTTVLILRYTTRVQGFAWGIVGFLMPLSCVFYPVSALPKYLRPVAEMLPTTHSFEGIRQYVAGGGFSTTHLMWCVGLNVVYFILVLIVCKRIFESARSHGLLVKVD